MEARTTTNRSYLLLKWKKKMEKNVVASESTGDINVVCLLEQNGFCAKENPASLWLSRFNELKKKKKKLSVYRCNASIILSIHILIELLVICVFLVLCIEKKKLIQVLQTLDMERRYTKCAICSIQIY